MGDTYGNTIRLCEQKCSIQRKNQKIVEESPSPFIASELRQEMGNKAVMATRSVNYIGAGTIEFLVDKHQNFFFLEMNTRLQVEHPVTEEVLSIDLIKIAEGQNGHAIELRICAKDTEMNFIPSPGTIKIFIKLNGIGVRIDDYVYKGYEILIHYDPMISKLIIWAENRPYAIKRLLRALHGYKITDVKTNINYLKNIIDVSEFIEGKYNTGFIAKHAEELKNGMIAKDKNTENIALAASYIDYITNLKENHWDNRTNDRLNNHWRIFFLYNEILRI